MSEAAGASTGFEQVANSQTEEKCLRDLYTALHEATD